MYAENLKKIRKILNLTVEEMAVMLDMSPRTLGGYERNERTPSVDFAAQLCNTLGVNINWFLTGKGKIFLKDEKPDNNCLLGIKEKFNLSDEDFEGLMELLESGASRDMVLKFVQVKKGNKEALDGLIQNLQGIKAIYE